MYGLLFGLMLTTFISVDGNVVETTTDSQEYAAYEASVITDIGNPDNLTQTSDVSGSDIVNISNTETVQVVQADNSEIVALLSDSVELLAENSSTVTGTINTSVLDLMDRMVDSYPDYYKYAGFRTNSDDAYSTTLYIAKKATTNGNTITFSDDCVAVYFNRYYQNNYSSYIYYDVVESPNASVNIRSNSIVYTNALEGYPSLGNKSQFPSEYIWISVFILLAGYLFLRRNN